MQEAEFAALVHRYHFDKVGEILCIDGCPSFRLTHASEEAGWVYLWVEVTEDHRFIVYVGKAGKTLQERCRQHAGGFRNSVPGRAHAERLRQGHGLHRRYELFARKSESLAIHGESDISMCGVEELAFIKKFQPSWNKQK